MENGQHLLEASKAYVVCQGRCAQDASTAWKVLTKPFVTLSRQAGAGGITIGGLLVEFLNCEDKKKTCPWTLFDRDLVQKVVEEHGLPEVVSRYMPEHKISEIRDILEELAGLHPSELALAHRTNETLLHLAGLGRAVLVGRGANIVTCRLGGFHVRLVGSIEKRIHHLEDYLKISAHQAAEFIKKEDNGRKEYVKRHFFKDIDDPLLYDLTINTDRISYQDAAEMVGRAVLANMSKGR